MTLKTMAPLLQQWTGENRTTKKNKKQNQLYLLRIYMNINFRKINFRNLAHMDYMKYEQEELQEYWWKKLAEEHSGGNSPIVDIKIM